MSRIVRLAIRLYGLMLRGYPRRFQAEFGEEMQTVFVEAVTDADTRGGLRAYLLHELLDAPAAIARAYWSGWTRKRQDRRQSMSWINKHLRVWRVAILVLLLVAIMGPWTFDRINVPAEYPCSAPNIRLEGDFCGVPLSGMWIFSWIVSGLVALVAQPFREAIVFADWTRGLLFVGLGLLLFAAPFSSLLLVISGGGRRRWQVVNVAAWGLALGVGLLISMSSYLRLFSGVWGIWLYIGLAAGALTLEALTLAAGRTANRG